MLTSIEQIQIKILFVCLGNICRSPAAHGIMLHLLTTEYNFLYFYKIIQKIKSLKNTIFVDSCGTIDYNSGDLPDRRMREEANKRGIQLNHIARCINKNDLINYNLIIAMDNDNYQDIISMRGDKNKVKKMIDYVKDKKGYNELPDPYYGGYKEFNLVLDLLEDGYKGIIQSLIELYKLK